MDEKSLAKIRESLIDHEVAIDKDALWTAINKTERRKIVPMRLLMGIIVLSIVSLSSYKLIFSENELPTPEEKTNYQNYLAEEKNEISTSSELQVIQDQQQYSPSAENESTEAIIKKEEQNTTINTKGKKHISNTTTKQKASISTNTIIQSNIIKENSKATVNNKKDLADQSNNTSSISRKPVSLIESFGINSLPTSAIPYTNSFPELDMDYIPLSNRNIECYDHRKKHSNWRMEFYGTVDYVDNNMTADASNLQYLESRKSSQTQLEGYRSGIRIKYLMRNGLYVKSGLEGAWIRDRMNHLKTDTFTRTLANQLLETYVRNDSTFYVYGDKEQEVIRNTTTKVYNTFRSISVPLLVGYEFQLKKLFLGVELGGIYNIYHDFEGHLLDPYTNEPVEASDFFKDRINLSATGGIQLGLELTDQMRFFTTMSFKGNLNEVNNLSLNPIQQRHNSIGLGAGVEFKL